MLSSMFHEVGVQSYVGTMRAKVASTNPMDVMNET
jgi:hypothetical protein